MPLTNTRAREIMTENSVRFPTSPSNNDMIPIPEHEAVSGHDGLGLVTQLSRSSSNRASTPPGSPPAARRRSIIKEPGTKSSLQKKTVSFSQLPNEANIKNAADCVIRMHEGHQFVKLRSNSRVYNRLYWFDQVDNCLRWEPSKKDAGKARIEIGHIREIRPGKTTNLFLTSDLSTHFPDECSFSIIHGEGKSLDLIANSADDANVWITGLRCLMSGQDMEELKMRSDARDSWLSAMFDEADINGDGFLDEGESLELLTSLSDGIREKRIKQRLQEYLQMKSDNKARLSREEFIKIFKDVATRPEVYFLLARFATSDDRLSLDDLLTFLESEQGLSDVTKDDCLELINKYEPSEVLRSIPALGIDGFTKYLISDQCAIFNPIHSTVCQDMSQPLTDYFIASSHNTYLMEDQVTGPTSVNAYVRALLRCCRCVELDCWDGEDGQPVVMHGHSNMNSVPFRLIIQAINEYAFRNSVYPLILCLENHCSKEQQVIMASDLKEILEDKLYTAQLKDGEQLPSPDALKNRILIRSRKLDSDSADDAGFVSGDDEGKEASEQMVTSPKSPNETVPGITNQAERLLLVRDLSDLVSICSTVTFHEDSFAHQRLHSSQHTCSIPEKVAMRLVEKSSEDFISHTKRYLTRVYPSPLRFDSSNFNPQDFWNCGAQMVSLNYQTPGLMMDINDGRFSMNGGCGYVLKPSVMRDPMAYYNIVGPDSIPGVAPKALHIRVISGQNFPKPRGGGAKGHVIDPYVLLELFGVPRDCTDYRTRTAPNNSGGFPIFDMPFEFRLSLPSLALVRFVVLDDDYIGDEFIGQYTIPFECLQPGYRHLHLRSIFDEPLDNATLFVHIAIVDADIVPGTPGNITPVPSANSAKGLSAKRPNSQKRNRKYRNRKESDVTSLYELSRPELDDAFESANELLQLAATLRDSQRWSLSTFRESCGVSSLASTKQCVRALVHRCRSDASDSSFSTRSKRKLSFPEPDQAEDSAKTEPRRRTVSSDGGPAPLRRQPSDASQSSSSDCGSGGQVKIVKNERRVAMQLKGSLTTNDNWKKVAASLDALVDDCIAVLDKAVKCSHDLQMIQDQVAKLAKGLPQFSPNGGDVQQGGNDATNLNGSASKKSGKLKKKHSLSLDVGRKRAAETNFRWNCSVIQGHKDMMLSTYKDADKIMADIWDAGIQYGLADASINSEDTDFQNNKLDRSISKSANTNSNNNKAESGRSGGRLKSVPFVRSVSQLTRPRSKTPGSLSKRSVSSEALSVTML